MNVEGLAIQIWFACQCALRVPVIEEALNQHYGALVRVYITEGWMQLACRH